MHLIRVVIFFLLWIRYKMTPRPPLLVKSSWMYRPRVLSLQYTLVCRVGPNSSAITGAKTTIAFASFLMALSSQPPSSGLTWTCTARRSDDLEMCIHTPEYLP